MKKITFCVYSIRTIVWIIVIPHSRNYRESGTSEELWDRLGRRMEFPPMNNFISRQSAV